MPVNYEKLARKLFEQLKDVTSSLDDLVGEFEDVCSGDRKDCCPTSTKDLESAKKIILQTEEQLYPPL